MRLEGGGAPDKRESSVQMDGNHERERVLAQFAQLRSACDSLMEKAAPVYSVGERAVALAKKPALMLEKRRVLKLFDEGTTGLSQAFDDPELRSAGLALLDAVHRAANRYPWVSEAKALEGKLHSCVDAHADALAPRFDTDEPNEVACSIGLISRLRQAGLARARLQKKDDWYTTANEQIANTLRKLPEVITQITETDWERRGVLDSVEEYVCIGFESGDRQVRAHAERIFNELLLQKKTTEDASCMGVALERVMHEREGRTELALQTLAKIGLDPDTFLAASAVSGPEAEASERLAANAGAALSVAVERPGAVQVLSREFGIQAYARYPKKVLVRQFDNVDNTQEPYGILMYPRSDTTGAFYRPMNGTVFSDFSDDLTRAGCQLRVCEAASKTETARRLISVDQRYGSQQKISFAVIGGHGNTGILDQGRALHGEKGTFTPDDVMSAGTTQAMQRFFVEQPIFVFDSCLVGSDDGIGQIFAEEHNAEVFMTDEKMKGIAALHCHRNEETGKLTFQVRFNTEKGHVRHLIGNELGGKERRAEAEREELRELFGDIV